MSTDSPLDVGPIAPTGNDFRQVLALHREHKRYLGFLTEGAFREFAEAGRVLAARRAGCVIGYLAYRVAKDEAVIVHLCVSPGSRNQGVCRALLGRLFEETKNLGAVRLSCRREYEANRLWPRHDFVVVGEKPGRSAGSTLLLWRRTSKASTPLVAMMEAERRRALPAAAIDANVFIQLDQSTEQAEASKCILADWVGEEVALHVTAELANEISRSADGELRARRRAQLGRFPMLRADPDQLQKALQEVCAILPKAKKDSDESDRRQLAHAVAEQADYFVTRDNLLLSFASALQEVLGIRVVSPVDLVCAVHGERDPAAYAPVRLVGTDVRVRPPAGEEELLPFQDFAGREAKGSFLARCRQALGDPDRYHTRLVLSDGEPVLAYAVERPGPEAETCTVPLLRAPSRHRLSATIARRVIAENLLPHVLGVNRVVVEDHVTPIVDEALQQLGFSQGGAGLEKHGASGLVELAALGTEYPSLPEAAYAQPWRLERLLWPLKVLGADLPTFVVPIRPQWASELFDARLAERSLFGAAHKQALALENVYYSGSAVQIPEGTRILWYVSKNKKETVQQIRAVSLCLETVRTSARAAMRRFENLGTYGWQEVLALANGDPEGLVTAYRFAFTDRFQCPVSWTQFQQRLNEHTGHGNPVAGPSPVPEAVFASVYAQGMGLQEG